jgi:UDPglucose 6-dehydrogenase
LKVGLCGIGKLGLPLSLVYAKAGNDVVAVDIDPERIANINKQTPFLEPLVNDYLTKYGHRITYTTKREALKDCEIITIIVNTPSLPDGSFDISVIEEIVKAIRKFDVNVLINIASNVNPQTCDNLHKEFGRIAICPEFIAQGTIIRDFETPKFTVVGAYNEIDAEICTRLWRGIHNKPIYVVKPVEAEIIKLGLNVSYCLGITWANIIGELSEIFNADSNKILDIMHGDWRNYKKGLGFGGPCFPRDVGCFEATCRSVSAYGGSNLASALKSLNTQTMYSYVIKILNSKKNNIGFLGIAYKPKVAYIDASQALEIAVTLEVQGCTIYVYDPLAEKEAKKVLKHAVFCKTIEECVAKSDAVFIGTPNYKNCQVTKPVVNPWGN